MKVELKLMVADERDTKRLLEEMPELGHISLEAYSETRQFVHKLIDRLAVDNEQVVVSAICQMAACAALTDFYVGACAMSGAYMTPDEFMEMAAPELLKSLKLSEGSAKTLAAERRDQRRRQGN